MTDGPKSGEAAREKLTHIPWGWRDRPEAWWAHVAACSACGYYYERPKDEADA